MLLEAPLITVGAAGSSGLRLRDQNDRPLLEVEPGRQLRVRRSGTGSLNCAIKRPPACLGLVVCRCT